VKHELEQCGQTDLGIPFNYPISDSSQTTKWSRTQILDLMQGEDFIGLMPLIRFLPSINK